MNPTLFATWQHNIGQRLRRLQDLPLYPKCEVFDIDQLGAEIEAQVDGTEDISDYIVTQIPVEDRRLREVMVSTNHALADCPSPILFGLPFSSDNQRMARYELLGVVMVQSGFPLDLLDDGRRFEKYRFSPVSDFFRGRNVLQINEQHVSCWIRRMVCFYGPITNVRVANRELRDNLARSNAGMTTEHLLQKELGPVRFRALSGISAPTSAPRPATPAPTT
jgi:hypothetical protein